MPSVINGSDNFNTADNGVITVTNANGTAYKFPDGRMTCHMKSPLLSLTIFGASVYYTSHNFTFPVAFITTPTDFSGVTELGAGAGLSWCGRVQSVSTTGCSQYIMSMVASVSGHLLLTVHGRWK